MTLAEKLREGKRLFAEVEEEHRRIVALLSENGGRAVTWLQSDGEGGFFRGPRPLEFQLLDLATGRYTFGIAEDKAEPGTDHGDEIFRRYVQASSLAARANALRVEIVADFDAVRDAALRVVDG